MPYSIDPQAITIDHVYSFGLYEIRRLLELVGFTLEWAELPLPQYNFLATLGNETNSIIRDKLLLNNEGLHDLVSQDLPRANKDQRNTHKAIYTATFKRTRGVFFINRPRGTGKTYT